MSNDVSEGRWVLQVRPEPDGVLVYVGRGWVAAVLAAAGLLALVVIR